jgi:hypothetical protein
MSQYSILKEIREMDREIGEIARHIKPLLPFPTASGIPQTPDVSF